ncbi:MAG TPA: hypothetical protein VGS97_08635 [Actinocrinis sp.]|uniref:arsenate-mycothiol transferase ArsC n=1 Tax=Actinocrinis sp. TaxID=1920516 RepID=UPI002DDD96B3|nr:hypothetical protein [Actinocrinis sp.]HEV2344143.1 hypothetical protein [Actinocrinis sp.]
MSAPIGVTPSAVPPGLLSACRDLAVRYRGIYSPETVLRTAYESYQLFVATSGSAIRTGETADAVDSDETVDSAGEAAVVHATRFAADWLADAARGRMVQCAVQRAVSPMARRPRVLFVCLHGTGRAQMAAALLRRRAGGRVAVLSAGPVAGRAIQPTVVRAMAELGIGISEEYPQPLLDDIVRATDVVVTMGCGDICPVYLGKRYLDWQLRDAVGNGVAAVRSVRDQIDERVEHLLEEMTANRARRSGRADHSQNTHRGEAIEVMASPRSCPN